MKFLKSPAMKKLLAKGIKMAKKQKIKPRSGRIYPLFTHEVKNGWFYQIDCERFDEGVGVSVYAFKPPRNMCARGADYVLRELVEKEER